MGTVKIDSLKLLNAQERHGTVIRLVRMASVTGLDAELDFEVLNKALDEAGLPQPGSALFGYPALELAERNPKVINKNLTEIDLVYEQVPLDGQNLSVRDFFLGTMTTNISQVQTTKDVEGNEIILTYTYPADDKDFPSETRNQVGEIGVFKPQKTWTGRGLKRINNPSALVNEILLHTNKVTFLGEKPGLWLCTAANYQPYNTLNFATVASDGAEAEWLWDFEFQFDPDGWNPGVVFRHEITGVIPGDLNQGGDIGSKNVISYETTNFEKHIGMLILH